MSWSEVDWLEVAGCLVVGIPVLIVGIRRLVAGQDKHQAERWLYWGLGMITLAGAAVLEAALDWYGAAAGIAVASVFFALIMVADRRYRHPKTPGPS